MYIGKLDDIVNEYNNTYHRTIKMKPVDVKDNTYVMCCAILDQSLFGVCMVVRAHGRWTFISFLPVCIS